MTVNMVETVKASVEGALGILTLDRPKALNALDGPMCLAIDAALKAWERDARVAAVLIRSSNPRAFCAGGDVRMVREAGLAWKRGESDGHLARDFFRDEYRMNRRIRRFPKPFIALMEGITMGGGVGLSIHGSHRIATEQTIWAMPETAIGLFPDVGTSYVLPRLQGEIGTYLALTGARIGAGDMVALGIASDMVPSAAVTALTDDMIQSLGPDRARENIADAIKRHANAADPELPRHRALINRCFGFDTVERILEALEQEDDAFAAATAAILETLSPTSLKLTLKEMRHGRQLDFESCLRMEYRLTQSILDGHDFHEGVRAQLVDKDKRPRWYPATLDAIDQRAVETYFLQPGDGDLTFED
jgi:enoyl-CoA hydratase